MLCKVEAGQTCTFTFVHLRVQQYATNCNTVCATACNTLCVHRIVEGCVCKIVGWSYCQVVVVQLVEWADY